MGRGRGAWKPHRRGCGVPGRRAWRDPGVGGKGLESPGRRTWIPPGGGLGDSGRARTAERGHTSDEGLEARRVPRKAREEEGAGKGGCAADAHGSPFRPARRSASDCSGLATRPEVDGGTRRSASPAALVSRYLSRRSSRARGGSRVRPGSAAAWPMAPQRRGAPKAPEGSGAAERRRPSSTKSVRAPRDVWKKWLRVAVLGACTTLVALLLWGSLGGDDSITEVLAHRSEVLPGRFIEVPCSEDYDSHQRFEGCSPRKCGRGVSDAIITRDEARRIRSIAEKGLSLGGSDGGASILDLHSGALSVGKHFVNLYRYFGDKIQTIFSEEDFQLYRDLRQKVQLAIAQAFGISASLLHLTKPTFFSRINSTAARTAHDEYWHAHVDKMQSCLHLSCELHRMSPDPALIDLAFLSCGLPSGLRPAPCPGGPLLPTFHLFLGRSLDHSRFCRFPFLDLLLFPRHSGT
ncbi:2-oxoglutarate and iron-dependent oxygenase domain-containing protein 3 isoform X2 [Balaenoptera musculus]|uniref:2-oxoglutarate and iron-dependent oxygenase domain-containing protein 3 isoform X2 n=1 Tax=Balaenoptera musculus TaxID=9771 RepID=A0A8B8W3X0_BALMU|nr:2-oxoglutarate and iron-dependent oxygenase domain-containing protein 3 isoform X2 [Balaenoptera musculus]